jgi:hypothetical protein
MGRLAQAAKRTFGRHLGEDETVLATLSATAAGTGRRISVGWLVGMAAGLGYSFLIAGTPPLPAAVFGGFVGIIGGYGLAIWRARRGGPGATQVLLALTDQKLLVFRLRSATRVKPLRIIAIGDVTGIQSDPPVVGTYRNVIIEIAGQSLPLRLYARDADDFIVAVREHTATG